MTSKDDGVLFEHSYKEAFGAVAIIWLILSFLFFSVVFSRILFDFPELSGSTTDSQIIACAITVPFLFGIAVFLVYLRNLGTAVILSERAISIYKNDKLLDSRPIAGIKNIQVVLNGAGLRIVSELQDDLVVTGMAPWKMKQLNNLLSEHLHSKSFRK